LIVKIIHQLVRHLGNDSYILSNSVFDSKLGF